MTTLSVKPVPSLASPSLVQMEDRKRPISYDTTDSAPPLKKQATSTNGASKSHVDGEMPWKDDLERFQKDAIIRQMQEYKREKSALESNVKELRKKARYHDDHLRVIDSWFKQLIDEVKSVIPGDEDEDMQLSSLPSALLFTEHDNFEQHLQSRSKDIRAVIARLYSRTRSFTPEVVELQQRVAQLLATEKNHLVELARSQSEKEDLETRLENASLRYMVAEKKIDRAKSLTAAKIDKQGLLGGIKPSAEDGANIKKEDSAVNGTTDNTEELAEMEKELNKSVATSEKLKEQIDRLEEENAKLTTQLTESAAKSSTLSDDDYAKTELFKQLKSQHEDVIKRLNHLEAANTDLKSENTRLLSERTTYQDQLEAEGRTAISDKDIQISNAENNLARIRSHRDELLADQSILKSKLDQDRDSLTRLQELVSAYEDRIKALESENGRMSPQTKNSTTDESELESLSPDDLRSRYIELDRKYALLNGELASMSTAFQKTQKLATQKVFDFAMLEEKVIRLSAEKAKADQKFFAAMKSKETRDTEVRILRAQNAKSAEVVTQLKEAEAGSRALVASLEKQLSEARDALVSKTSDHRTTQQQVINHNLDISRLSAQVTELKGQLSSKDEKLSSTSSACRTAEVEVEELKSSLKDTRRQLEGWKNKSGQSEQYEILRQFAYCNICKRNLKNTVIKTCGHTFCNDCVEERLTSRSRKCPNCGKSFGSNDHMRITL